jgi:hypothetical protein
MPFILCAHIRQIGNITWMWAGYMYIYIPRRKSPSRPGPTHYQGFTITLIHTTLGRTPLDEWSARRRDLYLITQYIHKRKISMTPAGFEPTIPKRERPQNHSLDHAASGIGWDGCITVVSSLELIPFEKSVVIQSGKKFSVYVCVCVCVFLETEIVMFTSCHTWVRSCYGCTQLQS